MARVVARIKVVPAQAFYVFLATQDAGDDDLVEGHPLYIERVEERACDVLQQYAGTRHQIWYALAQRVNMEIRVGADID